MKIQNRVSRLFVATLILLPFALALVTATKSAETRRYINLPSRPVVAPFSNGVLVGNTLYLAGTIVFDPQTGRPPAQIEVEVHYALDNLKDVLAQAGITMDDLVSVNVFCPDLSLYDSFNAVYKTYFKKDPPARAFIGSGSLLRGGHFEVMGVAVKQ
jgi:2-iminobutanoate/2-iminopropanoate deaminase